MKNFYWGGKDMSLCKAIYHLFCLRFLVRGVCVLLGMFLFSLAEALAQSSSPEQAVARVEVKVGEKVPDEFWTREHLFYVNGDTIRKSFEAFKGKMLVLDFWFSGCTKCLVQQKEINYFKKAYADDLNVVMINSRQSKEDYFKLDKYFSSERFKRLGLTDFVSVIEDDYLEKLFEHSGYPSYFWINPSGILQLYTFRNLLDRSYSSPFINKRP